MKDITCRICNQQFKGHTVNMLCSDECRIQARREATKRHLNKKPGIEKEIGKCRQCLKDFLLKKSGTIYCSDLCRQRSKQIQISSRIHRFRKCKKCGVQVESKPGYPVCADCKIDKRDPVKERRKEELRKYRKYGITEDQYYAMIDAQNGCCGICGRSEPTFKGWQIDHCHKSNKVRGILCHHCNTGIGQFEDKIDHLFNAIQYLKKQVL